MNTAVCMYNTCVCFTHVMEWVHSSNWWGCVHVCRCMCRCDNVCLTPYRIFTKNPPGDTGSSDEGRRSTFFSISQQPGVRWEFQHWRWTLVFALPRSEEHTHVQKKALENYPCGSCKYTLCGCFYNSRLEISGQGATLCKTEKEWAEWDSQPQTESFTIV